MSGRGRNRGNNQNNRNNQGKNQNNGQGGGQQRKKKRSRSKKQDPTVYWGDPAKLPNPESFQTETPDTLAIVRSLGRAPIPGTASEHYFTLMYDRAANMATLLGHAGGLDDMTPLDAPVIEDDEDVNAVDADDAGSGASGRGADEGDSEVDDELREADAADELDDAEDVEAAASEDE
jgi:hypothetical protein